MRPLLLALGAIVFAWATAPTTPPASKIPDVRVVSETIPPLADAQWTRTDAVQAPVTAARERKGPSGAAAVLATPASVLVSTPFSLLPRAAARAP
jgi:hypothetical protein